MPLLKTYPATSYFGRLGLHPILVAVMSFSLCYLFMLLSQLAAMQALGLNIKTLLELVSADHLSPAQNRALQLLQSASALGGFGVVAWLLALGTGAPRRELGAVPAPALTVLFGALGILAALPLLQLTGFTPETFHLPEALKGFQDWALEAESTAGKQVDNLLAPSPLWLNVLVVAVVPALAEEFFFRGILQQSLTRVLGAHIAIWLTAVLFTTFHLQFLGFFPRLLMGAAFGYLRYWSGSIWPGVAAHFANNAFDVFLYDRAHSGQLSPFWQRLYENSGQVSWVEVLVSVLLAGGCFILAYFATRNAHAR